MSHKYGFITQNRGGVRRTFFTEEENEYITHVSQKFNYVYLQRKHDHSFVVILMDRKEVCYLDTDQTYPLIVLDE